jgi:hypothetical protein
MLSLTSRRRLEVAWDVHSKLGVSDLARCRIWNQAQVMFQNLVKLCPVKIMLKSAAKNLNILFRMQSKLKVAKLRLLATRCLYVISVCPSVCMHLTT